METSWERSESGTLAKASQYKMRSFFGNVPLIDTPRMLPVAVVDASKCLCELCNSRYPNAAALERHLNSRFHREQVQWAKGVPEADPGWRENVMTTGRVNLMLPPPEDLEVFSDALIVRPRRARDKDLDRPRDRYDREERDEPRRRAAYSDRDYDRGRRASERDFSRYDDSELAARIADAKREFAALATGPDRSWRDETSARRGLPYRSDDILDRALAEERAELEALRAERIAAGQPEWSRRSVYPSRLELYY
eukprot:TRINITY_DN2813_c0_g1_i1.p1 TRINITY_DN2813_c0_g1~~TRINITY_DN2813_c0_g1_i1.p1  ORF type:complete len:253 (+),score=48.25 TRINITY_DN2813_c0_g1_i1:212-970(+)